MSRKSLIYGSSTTGRGEFFVLFFGNEKPPVQAGRRSFIALFLPDMARKFS